MNAKQNALEIIRFGKPERVMTRIHSHGVAYHGSNHQGYNDTGMGDGHDRPVGSVWEDIWGTTWHKGYPGVMGFPKGNPLADPASLSAYKWPDPDDERICASIYKGSESFDRGGDKLLGGSHRDTLWEKAYMLVGMENIMEYFFTEPGYAREILHRIMDFQLGIAAHYAKIGIEIAALGDDMGTQHSLLLGEGIFNTFLEPEYRRLFNLYKSKNVLIDFHSCGHVEPLLESFISLGVDVLNPLQATANDLSRVIGVTQDRMALCGGISTGLLMDGPPERIRQCVRDTIALLGKKGGYFCAPDQGMPFPNENYAAYEEAVVEFGIY
jgi:uroporphyrinogen decarboxylase